MKVRSQILSPFAARGIALMCAAVFVASTHTAQADSTPTPTSTVTGTPPDATSPEVCVGDCGGPATVTIDEIITLVNIALGNAQPSVCAHGVPSGTDVSVAVIIQAVNNALTDCGLVCGNGSVEPGEDCDAGGTCIGGSNAGMACTAEAECLGTGVCMGGRACGCGL